ncbi:MAG: carbohydrate kinase family protein [Lysobacter sp.]
MPRKRDRGAIVCFGEALVDLLAQPPSTPGAPRQFVEYAGGAPANVAVAAARLGGHACFVGMLGEDMFGDMLLAQLRRAGVDTDYVRRTDRAKTALAFVSLDADGERSFSFYRPPSADLLFREGDFDDRCFEQVAVFHVCSNSLTESRIADTTLAGMHRARNAGALVSMDLNLRPSLWPARVNPQAQVWRALFEADLVKLSRQELEFLAPGSGGEDGVVERLLRQRTRCVVVTDGAAPIRWFTRKHHGSAATFPVATIDTTAAGDAFVGALLQQLVSRNVHTATFGEFLDHRAAFDDALRFAAAASALATTRNGAFAAMPDLDEIERLLQAAA